MMWISLDITNEQLLSTAFWGHLLSLLITCARANKHLHPLNSTLDVGTISTNPDILILFRPFDELR